MKKKALTIRLDDSKLDYIDYLANKLDPARPNRTKVVELLIDLVGGSFTDEMVIMHSKSMAYSDGRKKN